PTTRSREPSESAHRPHVASLQLEVRVVDLVEVHGERDVPTVRPALVVRARGEDLLRIEPVMPYQATQVAEAVAGQIHPERALLEHEEDAPVPIAGIRE